MNRREFLGTSPGILLAGCGSHKVAITGDVLGPDSALGHAFRDGKLPAPGETRRTPILIVGGGISGLSAAWKLQRAGITDFTLIEMESALGGNSRSGKNADSAYPLGAHYVPLATRESRAERELLADLGIIRGDPHAAQPEYEERFLCHSPHERLFEDGLWHEGLEPHALGDPAAARELQRFRAEMQRWREHLGKDGRRAFAIPMEYSSRDPALLALDRTSMADWLKANDYLSPALHWWVNYACRDDYGTDYRVVSAWAGIHYYASRDAEAANAEPETMLTWPEGNGYLVRRLAERLPARAHVRGLAFALATDSAAAEVSVYLPDESQSVRYRADHVIWAAPSFIAVRAWQAAPSAWREAVTQLSYAPWLTATLTLREPPFNRSGASLAWDNVLYDSPALGYVVANHQNLIARATRTVISYYRPMTGGSPQQARASLLGQSWTQWQEEVLRDLERPHPEIRDLTERIDFWRNGHAMVRPVTGMLWGGTRAALAAHSQRISFAHADLSGFSVFEEANFRGVAAAERALRALGVRFDSSV